MVINHQIRPAKDETSETTGQNVYYLFPYISLEFCNCNLVFFVAMSINRPLKDIIQGRRLKSNLVVVVFYDVQVVFTVLFSVGNPVLRLQIKNFKITP